VGLLFWLGSSLSSTNGTALWSHNAAVVFGLSAIYLSLKASLIKDYKSWPLVSFFLFAGYLSRPTMALLTPFLLLFTLTYSKKAAAKMATGLTILVISFILFSLAEFHQPLPDYYLPSRINSTSFYTALAGNLISPSRGILIFMPIVTFAIIFIMRPRHNINLKGSWLLMAIAWPIFHLLAISRFPHWWGGYSYGPRLMTDCLPGLYLLLIDGLPFPVRNKADKIALIAIGFAASFSIWINTCQGLFNPYTGLWNAEPSVDMHPQLLFDWSYPQFAASKHGHLQRLKRFASSPNQ
jgi:hypothetical protein